MKSRSRSFLPLFSLIVITMAQSIVAETGTWNGAFDGTWDTTPTNWDGLTDFTPWDATLGQGNTAIFNTASLAAVVTEPVYTNGITFSLTGALSGSTITLAGTTPTIAVATGQTGTISSVVAGTAGLIKSDAGLLTLSSATYSGGSTVSGGRLALVDTKTGSPNFTTDAELEFNFTANDLQFNNGNSGGLQINNGTISGTGKFIKVGDKALLLGDYSGPQIVALTGGSSVVDVQGGLLQVFYAFNGVPTDSWTGNEAGINVASGATFDMRNGHIFADELSGSGTITKGGFDIGNNILTIGVKDGSGTFSGTIQDASPTTTLTLVKQGTGAQTLSGTITYRGGTTVNAGRLVLQNTKTGNQSYTTNAELEFKLTTVDQQLINGTLSGTGKLIKTGGNNLILSDWSGNQTIALTGVDSVIDVQAGTLSNFFAAGAYGPSVNWSGNEAGLTVASGATFDLIHNSVTVDELNGTGTITKSGGDTFNTLTIGVKDGSGTFSGTLTQTANALALVKQGAGTQRLSGTIGYGGGTTVNGGRLILENTKTGNQNYTTDAELEFNLTTGIQQFQSGTFSGTGKLIKTGGSELILSNWGGAQTVALTGADSVIEVQAGKLSNHSPTPFGAPPTDWSGNQAGLTVASGATFELTNTSTIVDELNGAGTINKGTWNTAVTLTIGVNDGSGNFTGSITQIDLNGPVGTPMSLVKQGGGTQTLSGSCSYNGSTTINGGTLALGANNILPGTFLSIGNATLDAATFTDTVGTLDVTDAATINLGSGGKLVFADSNGVDWSGGTLNITGSFVSGSSIKFATTGGLDSTQLAAISVNGSGAGTYSLDPSGYLVGGSSDPFTDWAGSGVNFDDDANNDGVDNGLAWLLGAADKDVNATGLLPKATQNGGDLKLTFTCLKIANRGTVVLNLQYSKDLGITDPWATHEVVVPDAAGIVGSVTFTVSSVNPDPDLVNLEATIPASAAAPGTKLFARLNGEN